MLNNLKRISFLLLAAFVAANSCKAQYVLDFRDGDNLKVIFDAGLRPWRTPGLESRICQIGKCDLTIILPTEERFWVPIESGDFKVRAGNQLTRGDFIVGNTEIQAATALIKRIGSSLGDRLDGLDEHLARLGAKPQAETFWNTRITRGGIMLDITFLPMHYFDHIGAKVCIGLEWLHPVPQGLGKRRIQSYLSGPIQPPPGYEDADMTPPKTDPGPPPRVAR